MVRRGSDQKGKSVPNRYTSDVRFQGDGMFLSPQAAESRDNAMTFIARLADAPFKLDLEVIERYPFAEVLERICHRYWGDASYYLREPIGREERRAFQRLKDAASYILDVVDFGERLPDPPDPRARLIGLFRRSLKWRRKTFEEGLAAMQQNLLVIKRLEMPTAAVKGRPENRHINNATSALCEMWKDLGGIKFWQNPDILIEGRSEIEFVQAGPLFVFKMLQLIDPDISAEEVRTALKLVPVKSANPPEKTPFSG